jgi:hypothetical protein
VSPTIEESSSSGKFEESSSTEDSTFVGEEDGEGVEFVEVLRCDWFLKM